MQTIKFTTIQAPNQDFIIQGISSYVGARLAIETQFIVDATWQERERLFDLGQVQVAWICGLPYIWKASQVPPQIELLVAPVMLGERYQDRPVYYSDVIVGFQSKYHSFQDLRGTRWAYNEPNSQSGYNITRYTLARMGEYRRFFGSVIEAGSHQACIQMVIAGEADAAAIDSTVLELEIDNNPSIAIGLRIITSLGPSPIPPLVISNTVDAGLRSEIRYVLSGMHKDSEGRQILSEGNIKRLEIVRDEYYNPIREMEREARRVVW